MAIYYSEFDTTLGTLVPDLRTRILANSDWSHQGYDVALATTSANAGVNANSLTFASGTIPAAITVGSKIRIDTYASGIAEYREVTAVTGTTITFTPNLTTAHASGTPIFWGNEVFKCTTARGGNMVFDLTGQAPLMYRLGIQVHGAWVAPSAVSAGVPTQGTINKYIHWRNATTGLTNSSPLHVVISSSKDHIFISIEGPTGSETGSENGAYGSPRNYFFMADLVPYSASDTTPTVVVGGAYSDSNIASIPNKAYVVNISKDIAGAQYWGEGKLVTLGFPTAHTSETVSIQRFTTADDEYYLSPYVVASDEEGFRGRLNKLFFAGFNSSETPDSIYPMTGAEVDYDGVTYRFLPVNKSNGTSRNWGPLGAVDNGNTSSFWRSPIVAIPIA